MQRASMLLNLYGRQAVRGKVKNRQKCIFCVFACFRPYVGQPDNHIGWKHQCPLHQFILLAQGSIAEIFEKKC